MKEYDGPAYKGQKKSLEKFRPDRQGGEVSQFRRSYAPPALSDEERKHRAQLEHVERKSMVKLTHEEAAKDIPFVQKQGKPSKSLKLQTKTKDIPFLRHHDRKHLERFEMAETDISQESKMLFDREKFDTMKESSESEEENKSVGLDYEPSPPSRYETAFKQSKYSHERVAPTGWVASKLNAASDPIAQPNSEFDYRTLVKRLVKRKETFLIFDNKEINNDYTR